MYDTNSRSFQLPAFPDGNGPLGVFGFLHDNVAARSILASCDSAFANFCSEVQDKVLDLEPKSSQEKLKKDFSNWVLQAPPTSHHISVAILQEHPSFLRNPEDLEKWKPICNSTTQQLAAAFAYQHRIDVKESPQLKLDSLLWTPDGALIAGFVDKSSDHSFERLRQSSRDTAKDILGDILTTRPKNLIHTTIGRIVGLPQGSTDYQHEALTNMARQYNEEILPSTVEMICNEWHGGEYTLEELSLARNTVWMLQDYIEYSRWSLRSINPE